MNLGFQIAAGTITGRDHLGRNEVLTARNNQDGFSWSLSDDLMVAVVTDGCGSASQSEVGAKLGAKLLVNDIRTRYSAWQTGHSDSEDGPPGTEFWREVSQGLLGQVQSIAENLAGANCEFRKMVEEYFLFTIVGVLVSKDWTTIFAAGDGYYALNGQVTRLGPFPENAPPYLAYQLIKPSGKEQDYSISARVEVPTERVQSILIGSDGLQALIDSENRNVPGKSELVKPLSQFWSEDRFFSNPDAIRRRLSLINTELRRHNSETGDIVHHGLLPDDTTLIVIRRG